MPDIEYLNKNGLTRVWNKAKNKFADAATTTAELNKKFVLPSGGSVGQVLTKTSSGTAWQDDKSGVEGVLPVVQGGTGCTTVEGIRTMLFNFPSESELDSLFGL